MNFIISIPSYYLVRIAQNVRANENYIVPYSLLWRAEHHNGTCPWI
jgi:hypothetical protein